MKYISKIISITFLLLSGQFANAEMPPPKDTGLPINTKVPEISVIDIYRNKQTVHQLSGPGGLILVLFRSADWCPFCKKQLVEVNQWAEKFNDIGYRVAAVSYDSVETLRKFTYKKKLVYPLLADQNHRTILDYKVLNTEQKPGTKHYGIPFPGVMIIDADGILKYKYFYMGYKKRVKMKLLYEFLSKKVSETPSNAF